MTAISDEFMLGMLATLQSYTLVLLRPGPKRTASGAEAIIWERGRRNFALRADGLLSIVCPVPEPGPLSGIAIFTGSLADVRRIMNDDPAVKAGVLTYEALVVKGFPGDGPPGVIAAALAPTEGSTL